MGGMDEGRPPHRQEGSPGTGESVQQHASELKDQALEKSSRTVRAQVDERSAQLGDEVTKLARVLRRSGEELRAQNGNAASARLATQAADGLDRAGSYLRQVRGDELLRDAERLARSKPWLVAGAAAVAGFAASRFLKASAESRYARSSHDSHYEGGYDTWQRPTIEEPISSDRYASPETVPVGSFDSGPAH